MAVFPESMNKLDLEDTVGSLRKVENYIHYIRERVEFANRNMSRTVSDTGMTTVEVMKLMLNMTGALSRVQASVAEMGNTVDSLSEAMHVTEDGELVFDAETNLHINCGEW